MVVSAAVRSPACAAVPCLALLAALCTCGRAPAPPLPQAVPASADELPPEMRFLDEIDRSRGHRDVFTTLHDPELVPHARAPRMSGDELVLGLDLRSVQVAYPVRYLNHHEIVEQTLAGLELLVCW